MQLTLAYSYQIKTLKSLAKNWMLNLNINLSKNDQCKLANSKHRQNLLSGVSSMENIKETLQVKSTKLPD